MPRLLVLFLIAAALVTARLSPPAAAQAGVAQAGHPAPINHPARGGGQGAVLTGVVVDQNQSPLHHARIVLENGQWTATGEDGSFRLDSIPAGKHDVKITARGHHTGEKVIEFVADQPKSMMVMLTSDNPAASKPKEKRSTFYIQAYEYKYGNKRYYVKHVEITQYDDPMKAWSKYVYNGNDGPGFYMPCEDAVVGKHYNITITWRTMPNADGMNDDEELTGQWYQKFDYEWETFTYYSPY